MEIIKDAGEPPPRLHRRLGAELRPLLAVRGARAALLAGSGILLRHGWAYLGERLHGWERYGACAFGGYVTVYGCGHAPDVARFAVPGTVVVWCAAAWWAAPPAAVEEPEPEPAEEPGEEPALDPRAALVQWLLDLIGKRPGIHLRDLYPAMRQLPGCESHDNARLRAALTTLGIPVHRSLRIGALAGRSGVRKADLLNLSPSDRPECGEPYGDAGQSVDSPAGESPVEQMEST